jgi:Rrf2 family protein
MHLLNKYTDYAVRALLTLAQNKNERISSARIAKTQAIPLPYMRRILQDLVKTGFVDAKEGKTGGIMLVRDPRTITIGEIIRSFQGEITVSECLFRKKICPNRSTCVLRQRIVGIEKKVAGELERITVADLLNDIEREK